jgi:hypothetical protein
MSKALWFAALFMLASGAACIAQSEQPSLGDLARKQHGDRKTVKTFTNEDVATTHPDAQPASSAGVSASGVASGGTLADASAKAEAKADTKKSESAGAPARKDAPEVAELKSKISSYKLEQDGWKRSAKRYQDLLANETSDFRRQMYQDALQGDQNNVQLYQDKIDQAQADLAKAEKDAPPAH